MKFGRIRDGTLFVLSMVALMLVTIVAYQSVVTSSSQNIASQNASLTSSTEFAMSTNNAEPFVAVVGKEIVVRQAEFAIAMNPFNNPFNGTENPFNQLANAIETEMYPANATMILGLNAENPFNDCANAWNYGKHKEAFPDGMTYRINMINTMVLSIC